MKKIAVSILLLAGLALAFSCAKEEASKDKETIVPGQETVVQGETVSISARLSDVATKVNFDPSYDAAGKTTSIALTWADTDKLLVVDHANPGSAAEFTLTSGAGEKKAVFSGTLPAGAASYDVSIVHGDVTVSSQTQPADGDASGLQYFASKTGLTDLSSIEFDSVNSVLAITAKMPADVAGGIKSVDITASENIFGTGNSLTITLDEAGDAGTDDILHLFATLPEGDKAVPAGTTLLVHFNAPDTEHTVYTRFIELGAQTFTAGKCNTININASNSASYANASATSIGSPSNPYLIGDGYQLQALDAELAAASSGTTVYAKLIDDIDLSVYANWSPIDASTRYIFLEGNNKTIESLKVSYESAGSGNKAYGGLFCILYGTVQNLTISNADVKGDGKKCAGILTGYICSGSGLSAGCTIDQVTIANSKLNGNGKVCGALAGCIGQHASNAFVVSITNVTVSGTTVTTTNDCGGLIALSQGDNSSNRTLSISHCDIINSTVSSEGTGIRVGGLLGLVSCANSTISDIHVKGTDVSGLFKAKAVGGIVGLVSGAADFDRCTYEKNGETTATVTGPTKHNNETKDASNDSDDTLAGGAYVGGIAGEVSSAASFDDCHVKNATVTITTPGSNTGYWKDLGGAFGYVHHADATIGAATACSVENTNVAGSHFAGGFVSFLEGGTISGCTVTGLTLSGRNYTGGFVGQLKSGTIRNSSSAGNAVTAVNATAAGFVGRLLDGTLDGNTTSLQMGTSSNKIGTNVGGFAGQIWGGTVNDCHASGAVYSSANVVGGFVGAVTGGSMSDCHASGAVTSDGSYIAGFAGRVIPGSEKTSSFTSCYATGAVTSTNQQVGGFAGRVDGEGSSTFTSCYATGDVAGTTYIGGLIGHQSTTSSTVTVSKCYATGNVTAGSTGGGLIGRGGNGLTVENCYATGSVSGANRRRGGILAWAEAGTVHISNCYSTSNLSGSFEMGGIVGLANIEGVVVEKCAAWNGTITASTRAASNWSSAAVVGVAYTAGTFIDNYRSPSMDLTAYWGTNAACSVNLPTNFQHPDVSSSAFLTDPQGIAVSSSTMRPYQGKCDATKTLSELASTTLGWSSDVWDFSGELPTLK